MARTKSDERRRRRGMESDEVWWPRRMLASPKDYRNSKGRRSWDKGMEGGKTWTFSWREAARNYEIKSDLVGGSWLAWLLELPGFGLMRLMMDGIWRFRPHSPPIIDTQVSPSPLFYHFLAKFCLKKGVVPELERKRITTQHMHW